jgi:hypothetical protein
MILVFIKKRVLPQFSTKLLSVLIGYGIWHITSQSLTIETTCTAPIAFYNTGNKKIFTQEEIVLKLKGKRSTLQKLTQHLAVHIDASKITPEQTTLALQKEDLFLPDNVQLIHYTPTNFLIHITC